jgi:hypothetical protein
MVKLVYDCLCCERGCLWSERHSSSSMSIFALHCDWDNEITVLIFSSHAALRFVETGIPSSTPDSDFQGLAVRQSVISRAHSFPRKILPNSAGQFAKFRASPRQNRSNSMVSRRIPFVSETKFYPVQKREFLKASTVLSYARNTQRKLSIFFSFQKCNQLMSQGPCITCRVNTNPVNIKLLHTEKAAGHVTRSCSCR